VGIVVDVESGRTRRTPKEKIEELVVRKKAGI